jgi:hypothetical protein
MMVAAAEAQTVILDPQAVRNIGEWAKKQACWKILTDIKLDYGDELSSILIDPEDVMTVARQERQDRDVDESVLRQTRVYELGAQFWGEVQEWGNSKRVFSPSEANILRQCTRLPDVVLNERQCDLALKALDKLVGLGFSYSAIDNGDS